MQVDPDILIVIATLVSVVATASIVAAWADRVVPRLPLLSLAIGLGLFAWVHLGLRPGGLTPRDIPDAFIHVAAMILN
ncbi:hypothetical protein [Roseicyclus persicicus]|uniref:Sodium:proton antiporter n=1 Tax=Roseicyclus persicicus TaxID=2650661 RepID=A0A7X6JZU3_9RHOB|nr:hypothetical protein [Roseibacterium persicicum]NKX45520.1 hypothetical protein [Roseibacterium persicicum]